MSRIVLAVIAIALLKGVFFSDPPIYTPSPSTVETADDHRDTEDYCAEVGICKGP